ncbi:hypothetical protein OKW49_006266 [Paraburkholderia youngii]
MKPTFPSVSITPAATHVPVIGTDSEVLRTSTAGAPAAQLISPSPDHPSTWTKKYEDSLNDLRNPEPTLRQAYVLGRIPQGRLNALHRANEKKIAIQKVTASYHRLRNGAAVDSTLPGSEHFLFEKNRSIEGRFSAGEPAFVRTLRCAPDEQAIAGVSRRYITPAKRELDTLMNNVTDRDIVATPSTLIGAEFRASIRSQLEKKIEWKGLPSIVYMPLAPDASAGQYTLQSMASRRPGFGDVRNFRSSRAVRSESYQNVASGLNHAEKFSLIEKHSKQYRRTDPTRPREGFSHSVQELIDDLTVIQAADPSRVLAPNEYFARLELWDAKAIEVGDKTDEAIATLIEFNVEMAALSRSLLREGVQEGTFADHLQRQLAWPTDHCEQPFDLSGVERTLSRLDKREIEAYLDDVVGQVQHGVTLCTYRLEDTGGVLRTLAFHDFSREEIVAGIERYLGIGRDVVHARVFGQTST